MVVVAFDPGAWLGWAAICIQGRASRFLAAGVLSVDELGEGGAVARALHYADGVGAHLVAVERVERVLPTLAFQRGAAQQAGRLVAAAWLGGELLAASRCAGRRVLTAAAEDVRRHFVAPPGRLPKKGEVDMDAVVWAAAEQKIALWPPKLRGEGAAYRKDGSDLLANRRSHAADAALLAVYAGTVLAPVPEEEPRPARQESLFTGGASR